MPVCTVLHKIQSKITRLGTNLGSKNFYCGNRQYLIRPTDLTCYVCTYLEPFYCMLVPTLMLLHQHFYRNRLLPIINGHFALITYTKHWLTLHCHMRTILITELLRIGCQERAHRFCNINLLCFVHPCS